MKHCRGAPPRLNRCCGRAAASNEEMFLCTITTIYTAKEILPHVMF